MNHFPGLCFMFPYSYSISSYSVLYCLDRYEQEELFFALNVTVKNATLQDSLDQFVKGELLEGENAYFCEKCGVKVFKHA